MLNKWSETLTCKFVLAYKQQECLWNFKSELYKNREARNTAYQEIIRGIDSADLHVTIADVKNKIKNLRSTYNQEARKIESSKKKGAGSDRLYCPNVKWFEDMHYIMEVGASAKNLEINMDESENWNAEHLEHIEENIPVETFLDEGVEQFKIPDQEVKLQKPNNIISGTTSGNMTIQPRKRKANKLDEVKSATTQVKENPSQCTSSEESEKDEFHYFGTNVASQLRKLPLGVALKTQIEIQTLLMKARLKTIGSFS